jgi:MraZ protein
LFLGQHQHTLDYKSRTSIPKKFREQLKEGAVLTLGLDGCLFLYPKSEWEILANRLKELPLTGADARALSRYLFSSAVEVAFDNLGRITIPDYLREHSKIQKKVIIIGVLNRVEIWADENWRLFNKKIAKSSAAIAEKLSGSGI